MIMKRCINIESFFLINRQCYRSAYPILKFLKKYYLFFKKYKEYKKEEENIFCLYYDNFETTHSPHSILCFCNNRARLNYVKKQTENVGRFFISCFRRNCKFFDWWVEIKRNDFQKNNRADFLICKNGDNIFNLKKQNDKSIQYFYDKAFSKLLQIQEKFKTFTLVYYLMNKLNTYEYEQLAF